ncbi:collagenase 3 isoform X1 [Alosa sapidissima]|uniref:collagenase 3 isoform X1 n=2 Tax=Alosa sapidissima TaxID=34773 RepID=UPI001C0940C8|nr:collagenase 3 isoform X1 [Alosa sapidissima]
MQLVFPWPWALVFCGVCFSASVPREEASMHPDENDLTLATEYLQRFYNFEREPLTRTKRSNPSFSSKLADMQSFFGLSVTGSPDSQTLEVMRTPRCGVSDVEDYSHGTLSRWKKNKVTFGIGRYTSDMPAHVVDSLISSAVAVWGRASLLTFVRSYSDKADIMVDFTYGGHGDSFPFDGPGGTLAHAFGPGEGLGGDIHFDDDEYWSAGSKGFNLFLVAAHEFGHALGLRHSRDPKSLMYPVYRSQAQKVLLSSEDIINLNALYASQRQRPQPPSRFVWPPRFRLFYPGSRLPLALQETCDPNLSFDAVTDIMEALFFFKDRYLWIKHDEQYDIKEGPIHNFMPKIDKNINAAYSVPQRSTAYLFNGTRYWTMRGSLIKGRTKHIRAYGFPSWVKQIDAAVHITNTGRTLFFTQDKYWKYNENRKTMEKLFPRPIKDDFPGINMSVNAAVYKDGLIHFFSDAEVYKYNYSTKQITGVDKANSWLGCMEK